MATGWRTFSIVAALAGVLAGCMDDDAIDLYVTMHSQRVDGDVREQKEQGCMLASSGSGDLSGSSGIGMAPISTSAGGIALAEANDFIVERSTLGAGFKVLVKSGPSILADKRLSRAFLASREIDRFEVTTALGRRYELAHRGALECEVAVLLPE